MNKKLEKFIKRKCFSDINMTTELKHDIMSISMVIPFSDINSDRSQLLADMICSMTYNIMPRYIYVYNYLNLHGRKNRTYEYFCNRYGEEQYKKILISQQLHVKKHFANNIEYWENLGHSKRDAEKKANQVQRQRNQKAVESFKGKNNRTITQLQYWIDRGETEPNAKKIVSELQCRDLAFFIHKYGNEKGEQKWRNKIDKWQSTLNSKSPEEIIKINKSKGKTFEQLCERHGYKVAVDIIKSRTCHAFTQWSKEANVFFEELDSFASILHEQSITGYKGSEQRFVVNDKTVYFVDYFFNGKIIEYYGSFYHGDLRLFESDEYHPLNKKLISDIQKDNKIRIKNLQNLGHSVKIVWSIDVEKTRNNLLLECKDFLLGKQTNETENNNTNKKIISII